MGSLPDWQVLADPIEKADCRLTTRLRTLVCLLRSVEMRRDKDRASRAWNISSRRADTLHDDLQIFLQDLAHSGFIANVDDVLPAQGELSAEQFAVAVLRAEGWADPHDEQTFRPQLIQLFNERYGQTVSRSNYRC